MHSGSPRCWRVSCSEVEPQDYLDREVSLDCRLQLGWPVLLYFFRVPWVRAPVQMYDGGVSTRNNSSGKSVGFKRELGKLYGKQFQWHGKAIPECFNLERKWKREKQFLEKTGFCWLIMEALPQLGDGTGHKWPIYRPIHLKWINFFLWMEDGTNAVDLNQMFGKANWKKPARINRALFTFRWDVSVKERRRENEREYWLLINMRRRRSTTILYRTVRG